MEVLISCLRNCTGWIRILCIYWYCFMDCFNWILKSSIDRENPDLFVPSHFSHSENSCQIVQWSWCFWSCVGGCMVWQPNIVSPTILFICFHNLTLVYISAVRPTKYIQPCFLIACFLSFRCSSMWLLATQPCLFILIVLSLNGCTGV